MVGKSCKRVDGATEVGSKSNEKVRKGPTVRVVKES